jgi:sugar O-acyltransferase (sialic acid O-acetyltransferase NeuD family)
VAVRDRTEIVLVGARGQAKDLIGYLEEDGGYRILCLIDEIAAPKVLGYDVVAPGAYDLGCRDALLAVGMPEAKREVLGMYARFGFRWRGFVDRRAALSPHARLGQGCILAPFAVAAGDVQLGDHVYLACFAGAGHDSVVGDYCSMLPYSGLGGAARLGAGTVLGAGARVMQGIAVGAEVSVAAGATVMHDLPDGVLAHGTPARTVRRS